MTLKIKFYSFPELKILDPLQITDINITAEEAIIQAAKSLDIKTNTMYLLSLYNEERGDWVFFKEKLKDYANKSLCLRFRWLPPKGRKLQEDYHGSRYLYLQLYNDFRHNTLKLQKHQDLSKDRKEMLYNTIVFHSIDYCIKWYNLGKENGDKLNARNFSSKIKPKEFYPKRDHVKIAEILRSALCLPGAYKKHLKQENMNPCKLDDLVSILLDFFYEHFDIGLEDKFEALIRHQNVVETEIVISPYNPEPKFRGVYYIDPKQVSTRNTKGKIQLFKLHAIKTVTVVEEGDFWKLQWDPKRAVEIYFKTRDQALQFIYALHGYIRLTNNFYVNINDETNLYTINSVKDVQVFGPITDEEARERLESTSRQSTEPYFLIKQRLKKPDCFTLFFKDDAVDKKVFRKTIEKENGKYFIEGSNKKFDDVGELLEYYKDQNVENDLPVNQVTTLKKFVPIDKKIYQSLCLCRSDHVIDLETDFNHISVNYQSQATIVNSEIKLFPLDTLRIGRYTNVCKASEENSEEFFAVKRVRDHAKNNPRVSLALSKACQKLAAWNHENICKMYGVQLYPFKVFLEYSELGSLCQYLAQPRKDIEYSFLVTAAENVARALDYLSNISDPLLRVHGNVRLRNVLIFEESSKYIFKLADSGCEEEQKFSSTNPRDAPEFLLSNPTPAADIYAYGIFIMELFNLGQSKNLLDPVNCPSEIYHDIVTRCREYDAKLRLTAEKAVDYFERILNESNSDDLKKVYRKVSGHYFKDRTNFESVSIDFLNSLRIESNELEYGAKLGNGHFGDVTEALLINKNQQKVAVKSIREERIKERGLNIIRDFQKEFLIMAELNHENVVKAIGFLCDDQNDILGKTNLKIVVEYQEKGCLEKILKAKKCSLEMKYRWLTEVARGMKYLSSEGIVHRDLAARNILLNNELVAKISDFGLARCLKEDCYSMKQDEVPMHYYAPEVLIGRKYSGRGDIWSYGVFSWEVITDCSRSPKTHLSLSKPYSKDYSREQLGEYLKKNPSIFGEFDNYKFKKKTKLLLDGCFKVNETERESFDKLIDILSMEDERN